MYEMLLALGVGQKKGCLEEPLTSNNCWLEVKVKRRGREAAWEKLYEAEVPEKVLAGFVQETHRTMAIPVPGTCRLFIHSLHTFASSRVRYVQS